MAVPDCQVSSSRRFLPATPPTFILLPALLRPARDDVFLRQQGRGLAPLDGDGIGLDEGIVLVTVALDQTGVAVFKVDRATCFAWQERSWAGNLQTVPIRQFGPT
ncbi:MAG: hypothetical protein Q8M84_09475 [Thiobacillus sp.]|nr:hypothetical protein [Gammaproteobacteria bacterium]MDP3125848.1 hypothetical protein [Thiobacillus sp.]